MILRDCSIEGLRIQFLHHRAGRVGALLIHGNSSCKEVFVKQQEKLRRTGLGIVVPDLPGHGGSDDSKRPSQTYSFPGYARVLGSLMRRLGYSSFHVLGWSLGGHIGIEMLASDPAVRSLLITGTPPVRLNPAGVAEGFRWTGATALAGRKHFKPEDVRRYTSAMMGTRLTDHHHLARMARRTDGNARFWMVANGMAGRGADQLDAVSKSERPIAVVQGADDPFLRVDHLSRIPFGNLWQGRPVLIDAGHAPHWQSPKAFNQAMMEFLITH
ncbi:pimeloyl-ACP methyl ester carboxylesterase [Bradyrhizobium elkanii]|uniref:alpha/beta fold hydrolase n=1 Tax=Bradyrhizobium elkanii TaxID=29448 RepID=UPI00216AA5DA|nr:alpha/beta hydrolase [Bradyrhizobium elkanii]MCS3695025.1 pimeloyl-ACP methyl ester carboxylesterase [Bradyrhizobium elkanii]